MISLKNGVTVKLRIPPSIMTKESEFLYKSKSKSLLTKDDYKFIKKWIHNTWVSKYRQNQLKHIEKTNFINSHIFTKFYNTKQDVNTICQLFVKETFQKRGFLYINEIDNFDGVINYGNQKLLIKLSINTYQRHNYYQDLHSTFFKYTQIIENLRKDDKNINMIIIVCGKQQDDDSCKILTDSFRNTNTSNFINNFVKFSKLSGTIDCIIIRDLEDWITKNIYL